jgi:hypothetical protein
LLELSGKLSGENVTISVIKPSSIRRTSTGVGVEKLFTAKFAKIKSRQDVLQTTSSIFWTFHIPQILAVREETGLFQQAQALAQVCAVCSPHPRSMSAIAMLQQQSYKPIRAAQLLLRHFGAPILGDCS